MNKGGLFSQVLQIFGRYEPALRQLISFWGISREELLHISTISTEFRDLTIRNNVFWYVLAKHYQLINENDPYNYNIVYKSYVMPNMPNMPLLGVVYTCGDVNNGNVGIPTIISNLRNVIMISAGSYHSLFLTQDGMVHACGNGRFGRLGDGRTDNHTIGIPTVIPNLLNVTMVSASKYHSLFLTRDGMVHACGNGGYGRLGDGRIDDHSVGVPTMIPKLRNVIMISAGMNHSLFLTQDGMAHACGYGDYGQLGDGITYDHNVGIPTVIPNLQNVTMISAGAYHSLFLTQDGRAHACGVGSYGRLGDGIIDEHNVGTPTIIPNLQNITMISAGDNHSYFLTQDGTVHACGSGYDGVLGDGITDYHNVGIPIVIPNLQNVTKISAGALHSLFLTQDGMVHACGFGGGGRLGDRITDYHFVGIPTIIPNMRNISMVSTGDNYSLFLTEN